MLSHHCSTTLNLTSTRRTHNLQQLYTQNISHFHLSTSKYLINNHWDLVLIFQKLIDMIQIFSNNGILKSFELQKWLLKHKFTSKFFVVLKYLIAIVVNFIIFWQVWPHKVAQLTKPKPSILWSIPIVTLNRSLNYIFIQNKYFYQDPTPL